MQYATIVSCIYYFRQDNRDIRSYIIVGAFVAGAILTPPDVISQFMLAVPVWLLYEAGIVVAGLVGTKVGGTEESVKET